MPKPRIRLPITGGGSLQAQLIGEDVVDGQVIVSADVSKAADRRKLQIPDVYLGHGRIVVEEAPHALWVRVGSASFRTPVEQHPSICDFISEVRTYARARSYPAPRSPS
jgi:hypothetical protein